MIAGVLQGGGSTGSVNCRNQHCVGLLTMLSPLCHSWSGHEGSVFVHESWIFEM